MAKKKKEKKKKDRLTVKNLVIEARDYAMAHEIYSIVDILDQVLERL